MEQIVEMLDNINQTLNKMLIVMQKPENPFEKTLALTGVVVGILGIIQIIDTIINWLGG